MKQSVFLFMLVTWWKRARESSERGRLCSKAGYGFFLFWMMTRGRVARERKNTGPLGVSSNLILSANICRTVEQMSVPERLDEESLCRILGRSQVDAVFGILGMFGVVQWWGGRADTRCCLVSGDDEQADDY